MWWSSFVRGVREFETIKPAGEGFWVKFPKIRLV
jgi:hypothetical protein